MVAAQATGDLFRRPVPGKARLDSRPQPRIAPAPLVTRQAAPLLRQPIRPLANIDPRMRARTIAVELALDGAVVATQTTPDLAVTAAMQQQLLDHIALP